MTNIFDILNNKTPCNAEELFRIKEKIDEYNKHQEYLNSTPIEQNYKIIEETRNTRQLLEKLSDDIKKPKWTDYLIIALTFATLALAFIQFILNMH